jgi:predicted O-methyltransferase YrrM
MTLSTHTADCKGALARIVEHRRAIYDAKTVLGRSGKKVDIWPTGITEVSGDFLRDLVVHESAQRTLEVGLGLGLSSIAIVEGLLTNAARARAEDLRGVLHTTMDYAQSNRDHAGERTLEDSGAGAVTRFIARDSCVALAQLMSEGERFDFAFIDGGHQFDPLMVDVFFALRLVKPNGLIVLDDHWMPAVQTVLAYCTTNWGLELELFDAKGPGARLVAFRNNGKAHVREWDHFRPFSRADLPEYAWR